MTGFFKLLIACSYWMIRRLYPIEGGFTAAPELFSNRISMVLAALTRAQAMTIPLGKALEGETATTLPTVAPAKAKLTVVPELTGILGGSIPIPPLIMPLHVLPLYDSSLPPFSVLYLTIPVTAVVGLCADVPVGTIIALVALISNTALGVMDAPSVTKSESPNLFKPLLE